MTSSEWRVPKPSRCVTGRHLSRHTAGVLDELEKQEKSLLIARHGIPVAVISSIPDPAWQPAPSSSHASAAKTATGAETGAEEEDPEELREMSALEKRVLEVLSDGKSWIPEDIWVACGQNPTMELGLLEIASLIIRRRGSYVISKTGMDTLLGLRRMDERAEGSSKD